MRILSLVLAGTALAAAAVPATASSDRAARGEARLAKALEGRVPGKPVRCIPLTRVQSSEVIDRTAILYRSGRTLYVNRPDVGRQSLDSDDILVTKLWGSQLCSIDTIRLVDRGSHFESGFVGLGEFVPYTKP